MKLGSTAELEMKKVLCLGGCIDMKIFECKILEYDSKKERIYLLLESGMLTEISLDALYECRISDREGILWCEGRVKERYRNELGNILEIQVENGFYKNNVKSVDKQKA